MQVLLWVDVGELQFVQYYSILNFENRIYSIIFVFIKENRMRIGKPLFELRNCFGFYSFKHD